MEPAVATLDLAKAGAIIADMIESYLAGGAPPSNPEGADHDDLQDCRSTSVTASLHLHPSIDAGASPLQSRRAPSANTNWRTRRSPWAGIRNRSGFSTGISASPAPERQIARTSRRWSAMWQWVTSGPSSRWRRRG